ncbi:methyltransferase domain-containing protein [Neolewinella lacunae]|uniref:Methyltransferase domain-containing protein n=1 Tax=Neolewinella lacunae TaxID=1517758 RepID=A0A923TA97_9BACT|nr:class I SAM-dependent methyltransferase [Neolewinella lacunae]MBC6996311.1 methyltransferase domain-containing protein [Neolewinella lacunae]MDN3636934.1 methyltransferase domain-containing protein [Neolewinella lacunae]
MPSKSRLPMRVPAILLFLALYLAACQDAPPPPVDERLYEKEPSEKPIERLVWQKPGAVLDAMGDIREKVIADIGAGEGFFATRLAPIADRVIAIEINDSIVEQLKVIRELELPKELQVRLEPRLAREDDPMLENGEVDIILLVNTFMYIDNQVAYLKKLYPALRPDGRIVIVDWKKRNTAIGPDKEDRVALGSLEDMLTAAGFHLVSSDDITLEFQYIVVADKLLK